MTRAGAWLVAASLAWLAGICGAATQEQDVLMRAMQDELERSMRELKLERMAAPYFMAYRIDDSETTSATSVFGALTNSAENRDRLLTVEMRIGSPELDNTNFLPARWWGSPLTRRIALPQDDDYRELRRQIWLATDLAYKHALETLAQKRAALQNRSREEIPDFAAEEPHVSRSEQPVELPQAAAVGELVRNLAAVFRDLPHVDDSLVSAHVTNRRSHYLSSEGTSYVQTQPSVVVQVLAKTQAADGTVLQDFEVVHERTWHELPSEQALIRRVRTMGDSLAARRQAEAITRYSGPVLFVGQAAAELFAQALAPRLLAVRVPIAGRMGTLAETLRNPFQDKIGARVLPRFLHVYDDPTLAANAAGRLYGGYAVDGDGLPAAPTTLVERGVLKTLLSARNPSADILRSSGNQRGAFLLPSNLLVASERGMAKAELRAELAALVAERGNDYGVVVERMANGSLKLDHADGRGSATGAIPLDRLTRLYKVYADGREVPIRKAELSAFSESAFRDIVAVSQSVTNYTLHLMPPTAMTLRATSALYGTAPPDAVVSISIPDLLFEEVTLRKPPGNVPRPPVAAHPYFAAEG